MKEKRPLNPAEAYRRSLKKKAKKEQANSRKERAARMPVDRRDPYQLLAQIQKYDIMEYEDKLNGDGRAHRKKLVDQFNSLRKQRINAGLEPINLPKFDPDVYEAHKAKLKEAGTTGGINALIERLVEDARTAQRAEDAFDPETGLPRLPPGEPPFPKGIPGLPPYKNATETDNEEVEENEPCYEPSAHPNEPKLVYSAPADEIKKKRDHIDRQIDDFLKDIYK